MTPQLGSNCGETLNLPSDFAGGVIVCPNPSCGQSISFEKSGHLGRFYGGAPRSASAGPILLDKIERSFFTSPAIVPVGLGIALVYGIVLYAIVSGRKSERKAEAERPKIVRVESLPPEVADLVEPKPVEPSPAPASAPAETKAESPAPVSNPPEAPVATTKPAPEQPAQAAPKIETASKEAVPPKPAEVAAPSGPPTWGKLTGTLYDCNARIDSSGLIIEIPGTLHILSPEFKLKNAPRFLTEAKGDMELSVTVRGDFTPGSQPLPNLPLTYQGAGIVFWADSNNYLRYERAEGFVPDGGKSNILMMESCQNGKTSKSFTKDVRDADLTLKIARKGSEFHAQYSFDGKSWIEFRRQVFNLPNAVSVGVSASNLSPRPFSPRFEKFEIDNPSAKSAKGS